MIAIDTKILTPALKSIRSRIFTASHKSGPPLQQCLAKRNTQDWQGTLSFNPIFIDGHLHFVLNDSFLLGLLLYIVLAEGFNLEWFKN